MKTFIIIFLMSIILGMSIKSIGQSNELEWAPIGATWTYFSPFFRGGGSLLTLTSLKDTLIDGRICRYLANENRKIEIILYEQNDTVYTYQNNQFRILYDFTAQPGDTVEVYAPGEGCENDSYLIRIDSIDNIQWGDAMYRVQWISDIFERGCNVSLGGPFVSYQIVEKIGSLVYFIPQSIIADPPPSSGLLQYSDSSLQICYDPNLLGCIPPETFHNPCTFRDNCDSVLIIVSNNHNIVGLTEIEIFPSPAQDHIILQSTAEKFLFGKVVMYDLTGKIVTRITHDKAREAIIDVSHLENGIYFLQVKIDQAWYSHKVQIQR